jgi:hypothetical protein
VTDIEFNHKSLTALQKKQRVGRIQKLADALNNLTAEGRRKGALFNQDEHGNYSPSLGYGKIFVYRYIEGGSSYYFV